MPEARLELDRAQILGHRRRAGSLDARLPPGPESLRLAAWAGLQDSVPRSALHSIHARVHGTGPTTWEDPSLVQLWGPRYTAYVVPAIDRAVFALARLPDNPVRRRFAEDLADRLHEFLAGRTMTYGEAGEGVGVHPNALRYAAATGRVLLRWEGARQPTVWTVPAPEIEPGDARLELASRYLHWPGACLVGGEIIGTWRRDQADVAIEPWRPLAKGDRQAVEEEAATLPVPRLRAPIRVRWSG